MNTWLRIIEYGLMLFLFLLPLQTRWIVHQGLIDGIPWEYGTWSVHASEVVLWCIFALYALYACGSGIPRSEPKSPRGFSYKLKVLLGVSNDSGRHEQYSHVSTVGPVSFSSLRDTRALLAFTLIATLSIVWSLDKIIAFRAWLTLAEGIALFCMLKGMPFSRTRLVYAFLSGMALQAGLGMYQFLTQTTFSSTWLGMALHDPAALGTSVVQTTTERWLRSYGTLPHPNILGGYLVVAIMLLLSLKLKAQSSKLYAISYMLLAIYTAALFFTFSRGAWVALLVGLMWLMWRERNRMTHLGILVITTFSLLSIIFWQPFSMRLLGSERLEAASTQERVASLGDAFALLKEYPFLGVGLGNYTVALQKQNPGISAWALQPPHNILVLIFAELGIVGIGIFLLFSVFLLSLASGYWLVAILALGLFDHYLWSLYAGVLLFWAICGLASSTTFKKAAG